MNGKTLTENHDECRCFHIGNYWQMNGLPVVYSAHTVYVKALPYFVCVITGFPVAASCNGSLMAM